MIGAYLYGIIGAVLLSAAASVIAPDSSIRNYVRYVASLALILLLVAPLGEILASLPDPGGLLSPEITIAPETTPGSEITAAAADSVGRQLERALVGGGYCSAASVKVTLDASERSDVRVERVIIVCDRQSAEASRFVFTLTGCSDIVFNTGDN